MSGGQQVFALKERVWILQLDGTFSQGSIEEIEMDSFRRIVKYYVHTDGCDSRLDAWLAPDRLKRNSSKSTTAKSTASPIPQSGPMITRFSGLRAAVEPEPEVPLSKKNTVLAAPPNHRARKDSHFFSRAKNIQHISIGPYKVETWYFSPYHMSRPLLRERLDACCENITPKTQFLLSESPKDPGPMNSLSNFSLVLCPFCLEPFLDQIAERRHIAHCCARHPPGNEIYRDQSRQLIVFEVDGVAEPTFCQHLALLCKLFLEHKALDYDMSPFLFYVLCSCEPTGCEILGYFSKEKISSEQYNLSCILTLPQYQGRGIGTFLIDLSYEITRREGKSGTPERPLSDLGEKTYTSYWATRVMEALFVAIDSGSTVKVESLVQTTGICVADIVSTLTVLNIISKGPMILHITQDLRNKYEFRRNERTSRRDHYQFHPSLLSWSQAQYEKVSEIPPVKFCFLPLDDERVNKKKRV